MNLITVLASVCMLVVSAGKPPVQNSAPAQITGDYVEVRTASVFAGPCHYNSELVTTGRDALLAMNITAGKWNGVELAGVRVMADLSADDNLGFASAVRKSEIVVDSAASDKQVAAVKDLLGAKYHDALGTIVAVRRAPIAFTHKDSTYTVAAAGFATYKVEGMPNDECCKQPSNVWYSPILPVVGQKVGYTLTASYLAGSNSDKWERSAENSAFYGSFAF